MANEETFNRIGMGVDIINGEAELRLLREMRIELQLIKSLGAEGRNQPGPSSRNTPGADRTRSIERAMKEQAEITASGEAKITEATAKGARDRNKIRSEEEEFAERLKRKGANERYRNYEETAARRQAFEEAKRQATDIEALNKRINERGIQQSQERLAREREGIAAVQKLNDEAFTRRQAQMRQEAAQLAELSRQAKGLGINTGSLNNEAEFKKAIQDREAELAARERRAAQNRQTVAQRSQSFEIAGSDFSREREAARNFDRDNPNTRKFRDDLALDIRAQREFDRQKRASYEQELSDDANLVGVRHAATRAHIADTNAEIEAQIKLDRETRQHAENEEAAERQRIANRARSVEFLQGQRARQTQDFTNQASGKASEVGQTRGFANNVKEADLGNYFAGVEQGVARIDKLRDANIKLQASLSGKNFQYFREELKGPFDQLGALNIRLEELRAQLTNPGRTGKLRDQVLSELKQVDDEIKVVTNDLRAFRTSYNESRFTGKLPSGNGPTAPPEAQVFNEKGFFTSGEVIARISRNILLYQVVSQSTRGLVDYIAEAVKAAKATDDLANALEFAAKQAGGNNEANDRQVESLRRVGQNRQQALQTVTEAERFSEGRRPGEADQADKLAQVAIDIAASRGEGIDKAGDLIEQLRRGESKFYKRQFGKTTDEIYQDAGRDIVTQNRALTITDEKKDNRTQKEALDDYVRSLTQAQKEQILYNFVLSQQDKFAGEAEKRSQSLAGRIDNLVAKFSDGRESVGEFISEIKILSSVLDTATGFFEKFIIGSNKLKGTGANGQILDKDIQRYVEGQQGGRQQILNTINNDAPTVLGGAALAGGLALFGRGTARRNVRTETFQREYAKALEQYEGNVQAATAQAKTVAEEAKPGLIRSVRTGVSNLSQAINFGIDELLVSGYSNLRAEFAARAAAKKAPIPTSSPIGRDYLSQNSFYDPRASFDKGISPRTQARLDYEATLPQRVEAGQATGRAYGRESGSLAGGTLGALTGNYIADKLQVGTIAAGAITVVGGIAGSAAGTAIGGAAGSAIGGAIAGAGGIGGFLTGTAAGGAVLSAGALTLAALPLILSVESATRARREQLQRSLDVQAANEFGIGQQSLQSFNARREGREFYFDNKTGQNLTRDEIIQQGRGGEFFKFVDVLDKEGRPVIDRFTGQVVKAVASITSAVILSQEQIDAERKTRENLARPFTDTEQQEYDTLRNKEQNAFRDGTYKKVTSADGKRTTYTGLDVNEQSRLRELNRIRTGLIPENDETQKDIANQKIKDDEEQRRREDQARQARINEQAQALSKLRQIADGSFRTVEATAEAVAGSDNPFVKVLSDQATALQRVQLEYGGSVKGAVQYNLQLERMKQNQQLLNLEFESFAKRQQILNQVRRETAERNGPGFSTRENAGAAIEQAAVDYITTKGESNRRLAGINGGFFGFNDDLYNNPVRFAKDQIGELIGTIGTFGASSRQQRDILSAATESALSGLSVGQIGNDPYLRDVANRNARDRQASAYDKLQDEIGKAGLIDENNRILQDSLAAADRQSREEIRKGRDPLRVREQLDKYIIGETNNIPIKDLTAFQFGQRETALRNDAVREAQRERNAEIAVQKGLAYQQSMAESLIALRTGILGGDASVIIQVLNDTQAKIDQEALQDNNVGFKVPLNSKSPNPYANAFGVYGRTGMGAGR